MLLSTFAPAEDLLPAVLDLLESGLIAYSPLLDEAGQLVDFTFAYLNPAAQRLLGLPAQPTATYRQHFAEAFASGDFTFHRDVFLAGGEVPSLTNRHRTGVAAGSFQLVARRLKDLLLVSLTPAEPDRHVVEQALRASRTREQAAQAAAERERALLQAMFTQAPVAIALLQGPELRITSFNERMGVLWSRQPAQVLRRPLLEAMPELVGQGFEKMLRQVLATGEPYVGTEVPAIIAQDGQLVERYYTFSCQLIHDAQGQPLGLINVGTEVTEQVRARQQVEQLNHELEARVQLRTQQLREQRQQLEQILAQVPAAIATLAGPEHRFSFANQIYRTIVGDRATIGQPAAEAQPELVAQGFIDLLDRVYTTGEPYLGREIPVRLHDAPTDTWQEHYVDFSYQPLRDEQGRTTGILTFAVDETEKVLARRQADTLQTAMLAVAQRQVLERQNVYQLFEQLPAAIVLLREPDHRIDYFNPAFAELFPPEEWTGSIQGHTIAEVYPRVKLAGLVALLDRVYRTGESQVVTEMPLAELQPGSPRFVTLAYQAYREHGRVAGVAAFVYDVTEQVLTRQQAETLQAALLATAQRQAQERAAQQAELRRIFEQAPVAIALMRGPELIIELANQAVGAIWGRDPVQTLGHPYFEALPDTAGQGFEEILAGVLHTGEPFFVQEAPVTLDRAHQGLPTQAYVNFGFHPLYGEAGATWGLIAVGTEVTEQVLARRQVQDLNRELAASNHALQVSNEGLHESNRQLTRTNVDLDTFVYTASHDLKAPITNIEGLLTALHEVLPAEVRSEALAKHILGLLQGAVERFQLTIEQLTDISRLQQAQDLPAEQVPLAAMAADVCLDLQPQLTAAGAQLTVAIDPALHVLFQPKNLRSILYNLLSNAVKYRAADRMPVVSLRATQQAASVVLEVEDNGLGLSKQQQQRLFGLFQRLHTHVEGTGVGLYMIKRLVENAGGTIAVQSQLGVGSCFTVTLRS